MLKVSAKSPTTMMLMAAAGALTLAFAAPAANAESTTVSAVVTAASSESSASGPEVRALGSHVDTHATSRIAPAAKVAKKAVKSAKPRPIIVAKPAAKPRVRRSCGHLGCNGRVLIGVAY